MLVKVLTIAALLIAFALLMRVRNTRVTVDSYTAGRLEGWARARDGKRTDGSSVSVPSSVGPVSVRVVASVDQAVMVTSLRLLVALHQPLTAYAQAIVPKPKATLRSAVALMITGARRERAFRGQKRLKVPEQFRSLYTARATDEARWLKVITDQTVVDELHKQRNGFQLSVAAPNATELRGVPTDRYAFVTVEFPSMDVSVADLDSGLRTVERIGALLLVSDRIVSDRTP